MKLYTVTLYEVPVPPESQRVAPVQVEAFGPVDAVLRANPLFEGVRTRRKTFLTPWLTTFHFVRAAPTGEAIEHPKLNAGLRDFR